MYSIGKGSLARQGRVKDRKGLASSGFEIGDQLPELRPFIRMHGGKFQTEDISFDPSNLRLVYSHRPTQPGRVNSTFKCRIGHHRMIGFNPAAAV